ncbi:MAG TPA: DNA primase [Candidatus Omnitrophota bacterium]|nr:DNA primase [Candidatus Omnitrophota bacterium]
MQRESGGTRYDENVVEKVASANDIVEIISQFIPLKRSGRNLKACCPFHQEKTPSFMVQPEKQLYHCFGCGAGGDVFSFLMRYENLTFPEALKALADRANIALPERRGFKEESSGLKEKLYDVCQVASNFYHELLLKDIGAPARAYLAKRKISEEIIGEFKLGWTPMEWRTLFDYLTKKGYSENLLKQAALIQQSSKGNYYDTFRGRLMFPILNLQNKVIAFGGRLIAEADGPKYLNSPETPIFSKRRELFGLNLAKKFIDREWPNLILVEGYMDFLALYQHGFKNAVATLGTALGEDHVHLMKRFVEEVIVVYDGDKAGEAAALRGLEILLEGGMQVKLVNLPEGEDPDDFLNRHGRDAFASLLKSSKDFFDYKLQLMLARYPRQDALGLSKICREMFETFLKIKNTVVLSEYFNRLARTLNVDENSLRTEYSYLNHKSGVSRERPKEVASGKQPFLPAQEELMLIVLMAEVPPLCERACEEIQDTDLKTPALQAIFQHLREAYEQNKKLSFSILLNRIQDLKCREQLVAVMTSMDDTAEREKIFEDCIRQIKQKKITVRLEELRRLISKAESEGDVVQLQAHTQEYQSLLHRLR